MHKVEERRRINFMVNIEILGQIEKIVPQRKRSDFVNEALREALNRCLRRKAAEGMDALAKQHDFHLSTEEFVKMKDYGRL